MKKKTATTASVFVLIGLATAAALTYGYWLPVLREYFVSMQGRNEQADTLDGDTADPVTDTPPGHDSSQAAESEDSLHLSPEARQNIGLTTAVASRQDFTRTVAVPAVVVERPGHSQIEITAPMTGVIKNIFIQEGMSEQPEDNLFSLRLTHEDVVAAQRDFLKFLQERDVIQREIDRLKKIGTDIIPERRVIEQQYQYDKAEASIKALEQSLILHGLTPEQVETIARTRDVLKEISIVAPEYEEGGGGQNIEPVYHVQQISVNRGQSVVAGQKLGTLANHSLLFVEGQAFEEDAKRLVNAMNSGQNLKVVPVSGPAAQASDLKLLFVADHVEQQSRALNFYLLLPNRRVDQSGDVSSGSAFLSWKFRPGQRMEIQLPTDETWQDQLVLPPEAVVVEGPSAFVFKQSGNHFERVEVRTLYRDKNVVVVEDEGQLAGKTLVMSGAYEMYLALKNQAGGGVDPQHGHSH
ncbi:MAG: efflux RND transporter periplasmic adaptor subunit [Mariniblastus sp.]|nr:efflux RND transporter periplasmic adaptor subunit [Mariniblastus sp.]